MTKRWFSRSQIAVVLASIASFVVGLVAEVGSDFLPGGNLWVIIGLAVLAVVLWALALRLTPRRQIVRPVFHTPIILRTPTEKQTHARRGEIVFVSLYTPRKGSRAENLSSEERLAAAKACDYQALDLENSNLQPAIEAITTHASRLEHCWMVSTTAADVNRHGSFPYVPVLTRYLREVCGLNCQFHGEDNDRYAIPLDDDALVMVKTHELIETIFKEAEKYGLSGQEIVADFTGGFRSMTLAMILACLDGSRDIQFLGTHYNERGEPAQGLFPVLFDFEAKLVDVSS